MTQEDKELLLKDLCARLPYGVTGVHSGRQETIVNISIRGFYQNRSRDGWHSIEGFKPYLRPMSSMTDEEQNELDHLRFRHDEEGWLDFVLSRYLDWRGLISKGLALEAPEGMYKTE